MSHVLVTGGSGFVGTHVLLRLLNDGHSVRTTLRNLARAEDVRAALRVGGVEPGEQLSFVAADLEKDDGWAEAATGCDYVMHVASPFPMNAPRHEDDLIRPAREGTLRVLRAARDAGVKRVVVTSSFAAIGYGHPPQTAPFTETEWTNVDGADTQAYMKSKTLAERAAWDFIEREGGSLELSVVNPVGVFGPILGTDLSTSVRIVETLMSGKIPICPRLYFGIVDVRDVADLHLLAMTHREAAGERFLAVADGDTSLVDVARMLRKRLGVAARRVPTREAPDWVFRLLAIFSSTVRPALPHLGVVRSATNEKARRVLGWSPRSSEDAVAATGESLIKFGLVKAG